MGATCVLQMKTIQQDLFCLLSNQMMNCGANFLNTLYPAQTLGHYILDLNPSTVSAETASVVSPLQVAVVLGKKENFSPSVYAFGRSY